MKDSNGHDWSVSVTEHPFLTGWKCGTCNRYCYTQDGLIPAEEPKHKEFCTGVTAETQAAAKKAQEQKAIDFLMETAETQGVGVSTVKDGHLLVFKTSHLRSILEKHGDQEKLIFYVKQPGFKN